MSNAVLVQVSPEVQKLVKHYEQQLRAQQLVTGQSVVSGVNWYEVFTKFVASVTQVVSKVAASPGDKRQAVIDAALSFWKQSIAPILGEKIGSPWVFNTFIEPAIERELPAITGGVYDALLSVVGRLLGATPQVGAQGPQGPQGQTGGFTPY